MDLNMNRGGRVPAQQTTGAVPVAPTPVPGNISMPEKVSGKKRDNKLLRVGFVALIFAATALITTLAFSFALGGKSANTTEAKYVKKDKYQAIFLNGGQVYFGKIGDYTGKYVTITDIYYLRVQQQVQPGKQEQTQDISLAKLGSELHGPDDAMVINREQVIFWENLKDDGQVVTAIKKYKENPDAAKQGTTTPTTPATPSTSPAASTTTTPATPSTTTPKKP